jgi:DNA-binding PadR family transcriptional regulator
MELPVLDLFVLTMLDRGVSTPYDLQHQAGLSQGAAIPALRRLTRAKLVEKAAEQSATKRPRHRYTLTAKGLGTIQCHAHRLLADFEPSSGLDTILRTVDMSVHYGAPRSAIVEALERAADKRTATEAGRSSLGKDAGLYLQFRRAFDQERLAVEARTLRRLARRIGRVEQGKAVSRSSPKARTHR